MIDPQTGAQSVNILLGIAGLSGLAGFLLALWLFKAIQNDLVLLRRNAFGKRPQSQSDFKVQVVANC